MKTIVFIANWELSVPGDSHKDTDLLALGQAIRRMREQHGMGVADLAAALSLGRDTVETLETGRLDPTYELLLKLSHALGTEPSVLVGLAARIRQSRGV